MNHVTHVMHAGSTGHCLDYPCPAGTENPPLFASSPCRPVSNGTSTTVDGGGGLSGARLGWLVGGLTAGLLLLLLLIVCVVNRCWRFEYFVAL